jgi:hypothetical protein
LFNVKRIPGGGTIGDGSQAGLRMTQGCARAGGRFAGAKRTEKPQFFG